MGKFPAGGWDLDDYDTFSAWGRELKQLPGSKSVRELTLRVVALSVRLQTACMPEEHDEEPSDEDGHDYPAPAPVLPVIRSKPRAPVDEALVADDGLKTNDPKVRSWDLS